MKSLTAFSSSPWRRISRSSSSLKVWKEEIPGRTSKTDFLSISALLSLIVGVVAWTATTINRPDRAEIPARVLIITRLDVPFSRSSMPDLLPTQELAIGAVDLGTGHPADQGGEGIAQEYRVHDSLG